MKKSILLATYNFYPYNWGGSEVYVDGLVHHLLGKNYSIRLLTAVPDNAFTEHGIYWQGQHLTICKYNHSGIEIYGVKHVVDTIDIYRKYSLDWENDWIAFFSFWQNQENWITDRLHLHGFTTIIGLALVKAFRQQYQSATVYASYHTPFSCPKGDLLRWGEEECNISTNTNDCVACTWKVKTKMPKFLSYMVAQSLPYKELSHFPSFMQWKVFINASIMAFKELVNLVDKWWVFSFQMKDTLIKQGVKENTILLGRHGVAEIFLSEGWTERQKRPIIFAFVGRFTAIKGLTTILEAWKKLALDDSCRQLWLVGDQQTADPEVESLIQDSIQHRTDIHFLGKKTVVELSSLYRQIHALIIPSKCLETGPLVAHEALACGANVIGSDIGGIRELSQHYPEGAIQVFHRGNVNALKEEILHYQYQSYSCTVMNQEVHYELVYNWYFEEN